MTHSAPWSSGFCHSRVNSRAGHDSPLRRWCRALLHANYRLFANLQQGSSISAMAVFLKSHILLQYITCILLSVQSSAKVCVFRRKGVAMLKECNFYSYMFLLCSYFISITNSSNDCTCLNLKSQMASIILLFSKFLVVHKNTLRLLHLFRTSVVMEGKRLFARLWPHQCDLASNAN